MLSDVSVNIKTARIVSSFRKAVILSLLHNTSFSFLHRIIDGSLIWNLVSCVWHIVSLTRLHFGALFWKMWHKFDNLSSLLFDIILDYSSSVTRQNCIISHIMFLRQLCPVSILDSMLLHDSGAVNEDCIHFKQFMLDNRFKLKTQRQFFRPTFASFTREHIAVQHLLW